ncbi:MAG: hypothetical protein EXR77_08740 [Myxococcales bacterium]|nr:hypothetical protein [Myxococcales bacterium]
MLAPIDPAVPASPTWQRFGWPTLETLACLWMVAAVALYPSLGRYDLVAIAVSLLAFVAFAGGLALDWLWRWTGADSATRMPRILLAFAVVLCVIGAVEPRFLYVTKFRTCWLYLASQGCAAVLLAAALVGHCRHKLEQNGPSLWPIRLTLTAVVMLVAFHALVPVFSPVPYIDSWSLQQEAADFLASGRNPYSQVYTQIYPQEHYGYVSHFGYLPSVGLWTLPFAKLLGDVPFGYVVADALAA